MDCVREFIESVAIVYPQEESKEIISRIQSGDNNHFKSAVFELLLHAALVKIDCQLTPHPELDNGSTSRPDFLVTVPDGQQFYLEAVLATENNESDTAAEARKGIVMDTLAKNPHANFMLDISDQGDPATQPNGGQLTRELFNWLDTLNPDEIDEIIKTKGFDATPVHTWKHEAWSVSFKPIPLKPERRGKSENLVGIGGSSCGFIDAWTPIKNAIKYKGSKYGKLNKPLLVAVNINSFDLDRIDEMQALFGQEQYVFTTGLIDQEPRFERAPNGAWHGKSGPQYTRVSGLWIFSDLSPYTIATAQQTIYFNPWAYHELPEMLEYFSHASVDGEKMVHTEGANLSDVFELAKDWPRLK